MSLFISKSAPIPQPNAVIIFLISSELKILSSLAFSTLRILPLSGRIACLFLSLPSFALPPAESPSTRKISETEGSFSEQSASLPGSEKLSRAPFLLVRSLAFLAASLALAARRHFSMIVFACAGFSSRNAIRFSVVDVSTKPLISLFPSFALVCPSNCGSESFTETIAVRPSLTSSPVSESSLSLRSFVFLA